MFLASVGFGSEAAQANSIQGNLLALETGASLAVDPMGQARPFLSVPVPGVLAAGTMSAPVMRAAQLEADNMDLRAKLARAEAAIATRSTRELNDLVARIQDMFVVVNVKVRLALWRRWRNTMARSQSH